MKISETINKQQLAYDIAETWHEYGGVRPTESVVFDMLEKWEESKQGLFEKFGNKLTIETSFQPSAELNMEEKEIQAIAMLRGKGEKIKSTNFEKSSMYNILANTLDYNGFLENIVENKAFNLDTSLGLYHFYKVIGPLSKPSTRSSEVERLAKLFEKDSSVFWYPMDIMKELNEEGTFHCASPKLTKQVINAAKILDYEEQRINNLISIMSEIQALKIKENAGEEKLVLSIHPMDYITASINDSNWSSCLTPDDCNAGATFSAMVDSSTFVAYVPRRRSKVVLHHSQPDVVWNDKKWRALCHFDEILQNVVMNHQYPHDSETIFANLRRLMREEWGLEYSVAPDFFHVSAADVKTIADSMYFDGTDAYFVESQEAFPIYLDIGGDIKCLECGELLDEKHISIKNDGFCAYCAEREDGLEDKKICCGQCEMCEDECG